MAEILRYLIEVDRRSLYATMGYRSLFAYCLKELKMSENEAGPRVAVARLAKEYSWVLEALAEGDVHLTGLFRLSAHMQPTNCLDLLGEARGKTVKEIDDLLANHFPKPDVPEVLRALPVRAPLSTPPVPVEPPKKSSAAERTIPMFDMQGWGSSSGCASTLPASVTPSTPSTPTTLAMSTSATPAVPTVPAASMAFAVAPMSAAIATPTFCPPPVSSQPSQSSQSSQSSQPSQSSRSQSSQPTLNTEGTRKQRAERLTPLSRHRHALRLTISTEIRETLERVRDLMSHRHRDGSFETIIGAALTVLLEKLERERLGKTKRTRAAGTSASSSSSSSSPSSSSSSAPAAAPTSASASMPSASDAQAFPSASLSSPPSRGSSTNEVSTTSTESSNARLQQDSPTTKPGSSSSAPSRSTRQNERGRSGAVPRAVRREVFARDGEQCSFVSEAGVRCDARSFLEIDHVHPKALGGEDTSANTRLLCATHNRLAAEHVFGRDYVHRKIRESRAARRQRQNQRE